MSPQATAEREAPAKEARIINGIELSVLEGTIQAIEAEPSLAHSKFRARNVWLGGNLNRTTVTDFFAAGQDIPHGQEFELHADEPPILAGNDRAPNPVEHLLNALAACLTTSLIAHAAVRGIEIQELESEVEGDIDLNGYLGLSNRVPKGYENIRVRFRVKTDEENLGRLERLAMFSPVFNSLVDGVDVDVSVTKAA